MSQLRCPRNHSVTTAQSPVQNNLNRCSIVLDGELQNERIIYNIFSAGVDTKSADWTVCDRDNIMVIQEAQKVFLSIFRIDLDLVAGWLDSTVSHQVGKQLSVKVRNSNCLSQS